jgi:tetratricopeptide (TPR) repeat protein
MRGLNNLGGLCNEMGLPNEGLPYLERALDHARLTGEETEIAKIYENMSVSCRLKGELIRAESIARQAEAIFRRTSNLTGLAEVWGYLGLICLDQGKWQEAVSHLQTSLNAWRTMKNERSEIETLLYLVGYDLARENHVEAGRRLREAESLLNRYDPTGQNYYLQSLTLKCRRNLSE